MRVHVTGASGFIGSHLCPALAQAGHDLRSAEESSDALVHLANIAHSAAEPAELQRVNVEGTRRQAERAARAGVRRFVYLSSAKAATPDDAYARAKLAAEQALAEVSGIEVVVLRPPLVYGPRVKANFLTLMALVARGVPLPLASIENRRSLVYVGNLCHAIVHCLEAPGVAGRILEVSDGPAVSTPQLCRAIAAALGCRVRLFPFPPALLELVGGARARRLTRSLEIDDSAIRRDAGWQPPFSVEHGLRETAAWYRRHRGRGG